MSETPTFQRRSASSVIESAPPQTHGATMYLRLQGHTKNPGAVLNDKRLLLSPGATLDVLCASYGGEGLGSVAYDAPLRAMIKRRTELFTYRFQVPRAAQSGDTYDVVVHGHDEVPMFRFTILVA